jgi:hypothetical protein
MKLDPISCVRDEFLYFFDDTHGIPQLWLPILFLSPYASQSGKLLQEYIGLVNGINWWRKVIGNCRRRETRIKIDRVMGLKDGPCLQYRNQSSDGLVTVFWGPKIYNLLKL